jgi:hypothetical protein
MKRGVRESVAIGTEEPLSGCGDSVMAGDHRWFIEHVAIATDSPNKVDIFSDTERFVEAVSGNEGLSPDNEQRGRKVSDLRARGYIRPVRPHVERECSRVVGLRTGLDDSRSDRYDAGEMKVPEQLIEALGWGTDIVVEEEKELTARSFGAQIAGVACATSGRSGHEDPSAGVDELRDRPMLERRFDAVENNNQFGPGLERLEPLGR